MPLLSIITRTFGGRPIGLTANLVSVRRQIKADEIQHVIVEDRERHGVGWANTNLRTLVPVLIGDYVLILDDDDFLLSNDLVVGLFPQVKDAPEVVIAKMDMANGLILPDDSVWGKRPVSGRIPSTSYIVRRDVWNEHAKDFTARYEGDFDFINAVWECGHPFHWWRHVIARVGIASHGQAEDGSPDPVLSAA